MGLIIVGAHPAFGQKGKTAVPDSALASKEILRLLMTFQDVSLESDESCKKAGTNLNDHDLGDYVSGWLAELKLGNCSNWISAEAKPGTLENGLPRCGLPDVLCHGRVSLAQSSLSSDSRRRSRGCGKVESVLCVPLFHAPLSVRSATLLARGVCIPATSAA